MALQPRPLRDRVQALRSGSVSVRRVGPAGRDRAGRDQTDHGPHRDPSTGRPRHRRGQRACGGDAHVPGRVSPAGTEDLGPRRFRSDTGNGDRSDHDCDGRDDHRPGSASSSEGGSSSSPGLGSAAGRGGTLVDALTGVPDAGDAARPGARAGGHVRDVRRQLVPVVLVHDDGAARRPRVTGGHEARRRRLRHQRAPGHASSPRPARRRSVVRWRRFA